VSVVVVVASSEFECTERSLSRGSNRSPLCLATGGLLTGGAAGAAGAAGATGAAGSDTGCCGWAGAGAAGLSAP